VDTADLTKARSPGDAKGATQGEAMEREEEEAADKAAQREDEGKPRDVRHLDPCERERLEAEMASSKPGAAGLSARSTRSKC
jgi:hypothetical protein